MNCAPPKIKPAGYNSPGMRLAAIVLAGATLLAATTVFFFNPATNRFYPICQFHRLTGLSCPGCGMTRACYFLLHGDLLTALHDNALFVALIVAAILRGGWFALNRVRGRQNGEYLPRKTLWLMLVLTLAFTVLRNVPAFAFLSPSAP